MRAWGGRFSDATDPGAAEYTRSIDVDRTLADVDLVGSIAHARGLGRAGLLTAEEVEQLVAGLEALRAEVASNSVTWDPALEDVHLNLEALLAARIGSVAGKLHTGRSRNDQVATDLRLWLRAAIDQLTGAIDELQRALVALALAHSDAVMPGHTHVQPAQPVLFAHHLLALVEMLERDRGRLLDCRARANVSPLGAGAIAGAGHRLDRAGVARELGFDGVTRNSIDAVGDRDFAVEFLAAAALAMGHLSRFAEELVWWSNPRFGFVRPGDPFSTGSSMMPNKRNPDPAELVRGRAGRVIGHLAGMLALLKGLPLGYQRDLQEDKPPLFETAETLGSSIRVLAGLVASLHVDEARMAEAAGEGFITATAVADALVDAGVPFREAHRIVGGLVAVVERRGTGLDALADDEVRAALAASEDPGARSLGEDPRVAERLRAASSVVGALERCDVEGGTAPARVRAELDAVARRLGLHERR